MSRTAWAVTLIGLAAAAVMWLVSPTDPAVRMAGWFVTIVLTSLGVVLLLWPFIARAWATLGRRETERLLNAARAWQAMYEIAAKAGADRRSSAMEISIAAGMVSQKLKALIGDDVWVGGEWFQDALEEQANNFTQGRIDRIYPRLLPEILAVKARVGTFDIDPSGLEKASSGPQTVESIRSIVAELEAISLVLEPIRNPHAS